MVATVLYNEMLGSVPDFNRGAVVAMFMLVPSVVSISLLHFLERFNIRYSKVSGIELRKENPRHMLRGGVRTHSGFGTVYICGDFRSAYGGGMALQEAVYHGAYKNCVYGFQTAFCV